MDAEYSHPTFNRGERDRAWIRELIDKLVDLETANRANNQKIKTLSAENTQLRNNVLDDPNLRQAFLEAAHKDHQALIDRHAKSVEQYNSIIDQHLAVNADLKAEVERLKGIILAQSSDFVRSKTADDGIKPDGHNDLAGRAVEHCLELKAEVERLNEIIRREVDGGVDLREEAQRTVEENHKLRAEVERLTKAGDAMAERLMYQGYPETVPAWKAAKEGKPQP